MVGGVCDVADVYMYRFGMHEDYDYYVNCKLRKRNMGLFTADQVGAARCQVAVTCGHELQQAAIPHLTFHRI